MDKKQVLVSVMGWTHDDDEPSDSVRLLTTGTLTGSREKGYTIARTDK